MIRGVIFDLDDTLYSYTECDKLAQKELEIYCVDKLNISQQVFQQQYSKAKYIVKSQLGDVGASHNRILYMQRFLELIQLKPTSYALEMYNVYWDNMLKEMTPFEYVLPLFQQLKEKGIKIGILTDLTAHIQHRKLRALGISEYVDVIVSSEEAGAEKPNKCMFELMIQKMGYLPEELLMIGDSYEKDCAGAEIVGIKSIHFCEKTQDSIVMHLLQYV